MPTLLVKDLTRERFLPYGDVIETAGSENFQINEGTATRYHDLAKVELLGEEPRALISIFRGEKRKLPISISMMERHPLGSQAFIPLQDCSYLVVVSRDLDGKPGIPAAFLATGSQGVNYRAGVWHHPLLALDDASDFLVVDRGGKGENLEEYSFDTEYVIEPF